MDSGELVDRWRRLPPELHRPWFRCESPERPPDPNVRWHYDGCAGCRFVARLAVAENPDSAELRALGRLMGFDGG